MTGKQVDKHTIYYEVLETIRDHRGCPLCRLEMESVRRYLETLLYECVNDPDIRSELLNTKGYCPNHARRLAKMGNAFGISILYQDQVRLYAEFLSSLPDTRIKSARQIRQWLLNGPCPACRTQADCRERYASTLIAGLSDEEMRTAYSSGEGLCAPHFIHVLVDTRDTEVYRFLLGKERVRVASLLHDLEEFYRKHDYRFSHEGFGRESDSWLRAIRLLTGEDRE